MRVLFIALCFVALVTADLYLHNPRGSNNRLDERNRNRQNANRLFDSQNNNKGGYNQNDMEYYAGSILPIEWTNQHSCGAENNHCELVFQYYCEEGSTGAGIRDGQVRDRIPEDMPNAVKYGRHESGEYYEECMLRERNMGLFTADQNLNGDTAIYTRQNTNGNRHGFECPEEREYYPYWHPTPWVDIAILTGDVSRCDYYKENSQNVVDKGHCVGLREAVNEEEEDQDGRAYNNEAACGAAGFEWVVDGMHTTLRGKELDPPVCRKSPWSRDNHLGNGVNGYANTLDWVLPDVPSDKHYTCVLRMRYNISTNDYDGWNTFAESNGENSPIQDNPTINFYTEGEPINLKLALNTDQYGRTFEDRSSTFLIKPRPSGVGKNDVIYNLNVKGQRGNIVQNYPSVEYDFAPSVLTMTPSACIHRQVTGSNTTPAGAGQGRESTDRSNFVEILAASTNHPLTLSEHRMHGDDPTEEEAFQRIKLWATLGQNDNEQDDAAPHQDFGVICGLPTGAYHYMSSRTNNFTNRSQKGVINVIDEDGLSTGALVGIIVGSVAFVGLAGGGTYVAYSNAGSIGGFFSSASGGSSLAPPGYA